MAKASKKTKVENSGKQSISKELLLEYIQDIHLKANSADESRIHCAIALNQILSDQSSLNALSDEGRNLLKEVWTKLKSEGIQLEDPPLLFGLPDNFDQDELAN